MSIDPYATYAETPEPHNTAHHWQGVEIAMWFADPCPCEERVNAAACLLEDGLWVAAARILIKLENLL